VITAWVSFSPRYFSASALSFCRIIAEISSGEYSLPVAGMATLASPLGPDTTLNGARSASSRRSVADAPMKRLMLATVFSLLSTAWRRASCPTRRSPVLVKATTLGVRRPPSALGMTTGSPPSITAMTELVVPRSMPTTFGMAVTP